MIIFVKLGDLIFDNAEVPQKINMGGSQMQAVHQLIGGKRVVDALGRNDDDIKFSGLFQGITAVDRQRYIEGLRLSGEEVEFSYLDYKYKVIVKDFRAQFQAVYMISYQITLTVVEDLTKPINFVVPVPFSDAIFLAYDEALDIAELINNPSITSALALVGVTINAIQDLNDPSLAQITAASTAISNAISNVNNAINAIESTQ